MNVNCRVQFLKSRMPAFHIFNFIYLQWVLAILFLFLPSAHVLAFPKNEIFCRHYFAQIDFVKKFSAEELANISSAARIYVQLSLQPHLTSRFGKSDLEAELSRYILNHTKKNKGEIRSVTEDKKTDSHYFRILFLQAIKKAHAEITAPVQEHPPIPHKLRTQWQQDTQKQMRSLQRLLRKYETSNIDEALFRSSYPNQWNAPAQLLRLKDIKSLIRLGADINYQDSKGYTALIMATYQWQPAIAEFLIQKKAKDLLNYEDHSALVWASRVQNIITLKLLLNAGYDANVGKAYTYARDLQRSESLKLLTVYLNQKIESNPFY